VTHLTNRAYARTFDEIAVLENCHKQTALNLYNKACKSFRKECFKRGLNAEILLAAMEQKEGHYDKIADHFH
jgi:hypothetical protein